MAPKRRKSNLGVENLINKYENILLSDALCPICRNILIEPVTLPCNHGFCYSCFEGTMENNTLTCPLCRIRIGSWLRTAKKENKIVNDTLWKIIQNKFPNEIQKKKEGEDIETSDTEVTIRLADPGEIRREYEIQLAKEQSELQKQKEKEELASKKVIDELLKQEEENKRLKEEKLRLDEEIAKRIALELQNEIQPGPSNNNSNTTTVPQKIIKKGTIDSYILNMKNSKKITSSDIRKILLNNKTSPEKNQVTKVLSLGPKSHTSTILNQSRETKSCSTAYKHILFSKTLQREQNNSNGSDSGDSIKQEMRYFKPIRIAPKSVPKYLNDGNISIAPVIKVPAILPKVKHTTIKKPNSVNLKTISNENSAFAYVKNFNSSPTKYQNRKEFCKFDKNGKIVKQYYNPRRSFLKENTNLSPSSPVLGFEESPNKNTVLTSLVQSLTANLNGEKSKLSTNNDKLTEIKYNKETLNSQTMSSQTIIDSQEKTDFEFAMKLHEELNNPRHREYSTRSHQKINNTTNVPNKNTNSCRKRQVTLEELVTPKKCKYC